MKIVVFGATGSLGQELVRQALEQGHLVTAFVRDPAKLGVRHQNISMTRGDVLDYASVEKVIEGHEAVLCTLGAGRKGIIRSEGTRHIIQAMQNAHVQRLICQTTLGVGDSWETLSFFWKYLMFGFLLREAFADHVLQENHIQQSQLDWTIIRPAAFTNGQRTGKYQHGFTSTHKGLELKISRADVAHFMLQQLGNHNYLHQTPGLSY